MFNSDMNITAAPSSKLSNLIVTAINTNSEINRTPDIINSTDIFAFNMIVAFSYYPRIIKFGMSDEMNIEYGGDKDIIDLLIGCANSGELFAKIETDVMNKFSDAVGISPNNILLSLQDSQGKYYPIRPELVDALTESFACPVLDITQF